MKDLLINGVTYEGVDFIKLPTKDGGVATYTDIDNTTTPNNKLTGETSINLLITKLHSYYTLPTVVFKKTDNELSTPTVQLN